MVSVRPGGAKWAQPKPVNGQSSASCAILGLLVTALAPAPHVRNQEAEGRVRRAERRESRAESQNVRFWLSDSRLSALDFPHAAARPRPWQKSATASITLPCSCRRQLRIHGQRQHFAAGLFGHWQAARFVAQCGEALLQMQRHRVVNRGADLAIGQVFLQRVASAVRDAHRVLIPHVAAVLRRRGSHDQIAQCRARRIPSSYRIGMALCAAAQSSRCGSFTFSTAACSASSRLLRPTK